ncbi:MAG TPA: undecaprenyl/decaprenyl-phosphate alpha-N-acetylglucosaminyl 1-phosphate transferase [Planctomycetaceae bacterium]|nr:undecaprenyl/decaprenyl-phosphate alpha-N-acetylglucosaminyl 1-phosphate transferase [Planctomycetaceae bacterium]
MTIVFVPAFFCAFLIACFVCFGVRRVPILDDAAAESHKTHSGTMPTGGGLGIWLGVVGTFVIATVGLLLVDRFPGSRLLPGDVAVHIPGLLSKLGQLWTLLGLGSVLFVLGTFDDRYKLSWKIRLLVQFMVAIAVVSLGFRITAFIDIPLLTAALSVLWIVALTNSFNMLDNMDGLSAGVAVICSVFLAVVMFLTPNATGPQLFICGFLVVLLGSLCGFLVHNNPFRTRLFMGDGGAYFIGFLLACATLTATFTGYGNEHRPQTLFVPLLILAVPLYDTTTVVLIRFREGRSPFSGDKNHFSHRLVDLGLSRRHAVLTIYLTTATCCIGALLLYQVDIVGASLIVLQTGLTLAIIAVLESRRKRH